ncbi:hypothetical protein MMC10_003465 [Thelotrema lepadinum]|nr:hypothetical protein [Thelotrema lepadinum]
MAFPCFDPSKSKTWVGGQGQGWFSPGFANANLSCETGKDTLIVANTGAANMMINVVTDVTPPSVLRNLPGVLGLGYLKSQYSNDPFSLIRNLMANNKLESPIVSLDLQPRPQDDVDQSLMIGAMDTSRFNNSWQGTVAATDLDTIGPQGEIVGRWLVEVSGYGASGNIHYGITDGPTDGMWIEFRTSTSAMLLPDYVVDNYWSMALGSSNISGAWQFPCLSLLTMPRLEIAFSTSTIDMPAWAMCHMLPDGETCQNDILTQSPTSIAQLGYQFFEWYYTIFNFETGNITFSPYVEQTITLQAFLDTANLQPGHPDTGSYPTSSSLTSASPPYPTGVNSTTSETSSSSPYSTTTGMGGTSSVSVAGTNQYLRVHRS